MSIQAVFFDMGGTIETFRYDREMRLKATPALNQLLLSNGINLSLENEVLFELITSGLKKYHQWAIESLIELAPSRVWKDYVLKDYPQFFPILEKIGENLMYWIDINFYERELRAEVPAVLEQLKNMGLTLGVISNICSHAQVPENLKKYGIIQYFDTILTSADYKRRKPDPAIFHRAAYLAKVPTSKCIYVGDRILRDIIGAQRAGFHMAIQITHKFDHGEIDEGAKPDAVIASMDELIMIIKSDLAKEQRQLVPNQGIKAILFDAGDILYYRPRRGILFKEFLAERGLTLNGNTPRRQELKQMAYNGDISREDYFREVIKTYGISDESCVEKGAAILSKADDDIVFFEGVLDTLKELKKQGYYLGIITDSAVPVSIKLSWFDKGGFADVWDSYISSQEIGVQKPDPKIYLAALEQLGLEPRQAVFVGHNSEELEGARVIGMLSIAFNRDNDAKADIVIENFPELIDVTSGWMETVN